jgi:phosphoribosylformylglycinamidine synthase
MKARVTVTLKSGVLDPQGQAIQGSLKALGFGGVHGVRQGKVFDVEFDGTDTAAAEASLKAMCEKLLANTVIENYAIEIVGERGKSGGKATSKAAAEASADSAG